MASDETTVINLMYAVDDYWHTMSSISTTHRLAEGRLALEKAISAALAAARAEGAAAAMCSDCPKRTEETTDAP